MSMKLIGYLKKKKRNIEYRAMQKLTHKYIPKDIRLSANSCDVVQLCTAREYLVCKDPSLWATTLKKGQDIAAQALVEELKPYIKFEAEGDNTGERFTLRASIKIVKR